MKTTTSRRIALSVCLSALLAGPVLAAFGDNNSAAGSALPPGNYPSSPSSAPSTGNSDSKHTDDSPRKQPQKKAPKPAETSKERKDKARSGN
ncbi:hypothetical protein Q1J45_10910 [Pseudomonas rhodesiae]|uniref:hypothetical protein n=1 Tax=unclassified Pseudomonas TaxID=196821 RepID=UPI002734F094|nr:MULTISPECIES: hypothetical protein [unclassified Pseudomonas]WLH38855.1 hypothetical protein PSH94_14630 [Pseudomonas sp. FP2254]